VSVEVGVCFGRSWCVCVEVGLLVHKGKKVCVCKKKKVCVRSKLVSNDSDVRHDSYDSYV